MADLGRIIDNLAGMSRTLHSIGGLPTKAIEVDDATYRALMASPAKELFFDPSLVGPPLSIGGIRFVKEDDKPTNA